jgi:nucleotide-binding universal stress UspA family protein
MRDRFVLASPAIRDILFPSDLSPVSDRAFDHARLLAERFQARLTLFHVVEAPPPRGDEREDEMWRRAARAAHEHLDRQSGDLRGVSDIVIAREGLADHALLARIHREKADLVVMATRGRRGLAGFLLGSVAETVVRHGGRPVLCIREPEHGAALPYRRILVPTDLTPASRRAFPMAATLARGFGSEVLAVHVAHVAARRGLVGVSHAVEASPSEEAVVRFLDPDFRGLRVGARVLIGPAWQRIVEAARAERADLVALSTHGHDSMSDRIFGSHAERVVRQGPCPVLVV